MLFACNTSHVSKNQNTNTQLTSELSNDFKSDFTFQFIEIDKMTAYENGDQEIYREIQNNILPRTFELSDKKIKIENLGIETIKITENSVSNFFSNTDKAKFFKEYLLDKFGITIPNKVKVVNVNKSNSTFNQIFNNAILSDGYLFFEHKNYLISFADKGKIKPFYKIDVSLPLLYENENYFLEHSLKDSDFSLNESIEYDPEYEDAFIVTLPKYKKYKPTIISICDKLGECTEYLTVFDEKNNQISNLTIGYSSSYELNEAVIYSSHFQSIDKNYNISIIETTTNVDLVNEEIINRDKVNVTYKINNSGQIEKVE